MPMISSLAPGERVLLVVPVRVPSDPLWMQLISRSSNQWANVLGHDPLLRRVAQTSTDSHGSGLPVRLTLFIRRNQSITPGPHPS